MKIEKIIYDTTRGVINLEDKLSIATLFLFSYKLSTVKFSELLYCEDKQNFVDDLHESFKDYDVSFNIRFSDKNVKEAFNLTLKKVIEQEDKNGFHKAVFEKDEFAMVILDIVDYNFSKIECKKIMNEIGQQLKLF